VRLEEAAVRSGAFLYWLIPGTPVGDAFAGVRVYAFPNSGPRYDVGFLIGLSASGGGAYSDGRQRQ
jgi:hypothetical protein